MSYLNPLRLHFCGRFQASVSTVNNDVTHFNNATFQPSDQLPQSQTALNGWWNPTGDGVWRLLGCEVKSAFGKDGLPVAAGDPVLTMMVADSDNSAPAKLVDLDPQQQMVSTVFGLQVRIADQAGNTLVRGVMDPAPFVGIWPRAQGNSGDIAAGATFQSVIRGVEWGDVSGSPFLQQLKAASAEGLLSIKFNVDQYSMTSTGPQFCRGRLVGSIGPATASEPEHFTIGRQFMAQFAGGGFPNPVNGINNCTGVLDETTRKILVDLGNALPTNASTPDLFNLGALTLEYPASYDNNGNPQWASLGAIPYLQAGWYETTAGVVALPPDRALTAQELTVLKSNPLALFTTPAGKPPLLAITEPPNGVHVGMGEFVFRLTPKVNADAGTWLVHARLFTTQYGAPYPNAPVICFFDQAWLQGGPGEPPVGVPESALTFSSRVISDASGVVQFAIAASDPRNPRGYIDGQVYGIRCALEETLGYGAAYPFAPWDLISLLVFDAFKADSPPAWLGTPGGSLQPIFQQYANLYPVMNRFLNLGDYDDVCNYARMLGFAFSLPDTDPNAMPVTRDLSPAKRAAILAWLNHPGPDGKPLKGTSAPASGAQAAALESVAAPKAPAKPGGGKAAAMARMKFARR